MTTPARADLVLRLVADLGAIFHVHAAYAPGHPQVRTTVERVLAALDAWCAHTGRPEATLILLEGHLLLDRQPVPDDAKWALGLSRAFQRHDIGGMTLIRGLDAAELLAFLEGCATPRGAVSTAHLVVGRGGLAGGEPAEGGGAGASPGASSSGTSVERVEGARAEFLAVVGGGVPRIDRLRTLVARLARGAGASVVAPEDLGVGRTDDREFLHGLAVAVATSRLGRALRLEGKALEDLTLAGLLHDVGHLDAAPGEGPVRARALHTARGAARLAGLDGVPDAAVIAALDHHLRFDGLPVGRGPGPARIPGAAARVVAVADTWETVRSQPGSGPETALAALRARSGTFLDPSLVEVFSRLRIARAARPGADRT